MNKTWCIGVVNAAFVAAMENILRLYRLPYDRDYPVICFDERPCFLIGDVIKGLELKPGQVRKQHYEYAKNGSCCLLMAIEPLTGRRIAKVYDQRRKVDYADFMQLVSQYWSDAKILRLIQDNLNTHKKGSFYDKFDAQTAFELANRFEFHFTPLKGSWLNAVEMEFSAIARGCLKRRIPTKQMLEQQILTFVKERQDQQIKINWKFDISIARRKMNSKYVLVNAENSKYG